MCVKISKSSPDTLYGKLNNLTLIKKLKKKKPRDGKQQSDDVPVDLILVSVGAVVIT